MQKNKVILLGATGQLGKMLRFYWPDPHDLVCQSRTAQPGFVAFDPALDLTDQDFGQDDFRAIICLSGVTPARAARTGEALEGNTTLALGALRLAERLKCRRVFLASSAAVYGAAPGVQQETAQCVPLSDYGRAKLHMEQQALAHARQTSLDATALRIGNVAGADAILGNWQPGMTIDQLPDGTTPRRSYIGPATLARVIHRLTHTDALPPILNLAAPGTVQMAALLDAAGLGWQPRPAGTGVIASVALCTSRLEHHVRFTAEDSAAPQMVAQWQHMDTKIRQ